MIPTEGEFLFVDETVIILVEHLEDVMSLFLRKGVDVALVVTEEGLADQAELVQVQLPISVSKTFIFIRSSIFTVFKNLIRL